MKKILVFVIVVLVIFLNACEPEAYYFRNSERNDEIVSVDLISYTTDSIEIVESNEEILNVSVDSIILLETVDGSYLDDFIDDFSNIEFLLGFPRMNSPSGICIKINYENGDFLLIMDFEKDEISYGDAILYDSSGNFKEYFGGSSWRENYLNLINDYFEIDYE